MEVFIDLDDERARHSSEGLSLRDLPLDMCALQLTFAASLVFTGSTVTQTKRC